MVVVFLEDGADNSQSAQAAKEILEAYYKIDIQESENLKEDMSAQIYVETEN